MKNIKSIGIFARLKQIFNRETLGSLKYLEKVLSKVEKTILVFLILVLVSIGVYFWVDKWLKTTHEVPAFGGTYVEGILGEPKDLDKHIARLTNAGLTRIDEKGQISGDLAEKWEIVDDGKTYKFTIRNEFSAQDLLAQLKSKNPWPNIDISAEQNTLIFKFKQPFSPFLSTTTEPIFPYGPYKLVKEDRAKAVLQARDDYWRGKSHIEKININLYQDYEGLLKAARHSDIMGYLKQNKNDYQDREVALYELAMPRENGLFFNLSRQDLQNADRRRNLRDNKPIDKDLNLTLVTSDKEKNIKKAEEIRDKWKPLKVNLTIKSYSNATLQKEIIPKRDYDILLFGLDYGSDPDPYPFWHSSQNKPDGMNLANFSNIKADKLLEEARQTYDAKVRQDKYSEFQGILNNEVPYISLGKDTCYYVVSNDVKGVGQIFGYSETDRFLNVDDWYLKTKRVPN